MAQRLRKPPPPLCIRGMAGEKLRVGATLRIGDGEKLRMDGAVWTRDGIVVLRGSIWMREVMPFRSSH